MFEEAYQKTLMIFLDEAEAWDKARVLERFDGDYEKALADLRNTILGFLKCKNLSCH